MRRNDWFETFLRSRVQPEASGLDLENAWAQLQQRRRRQRQRRIFFLLLWGVLAGAGLGFWLWNRPAPDSAPGQPVRAADIAAANNTAVPDGSSAAPATEAIKNATPDRSFTAKAVAVREPSIKINPATAGDFFNRIPEQYELEKNAPAEKNPASGDPANVLVHDGAAGPDWAFPSLPLIKRPIYSAVQKIDFQHVEAGLFAQKKSNKYPKWLLGMELGYGLHFVNRSGGDATWLGLRSEEEVPLDIFSAGVTLRRHLNRRWFLQTGLGWVRGADRRSFTSEKTVTEIKPDQLVQIIIHADGTQEEVFSDAPVTTVTRTQGVQYNRFDRFEIPVLAGYEILPGQKTGWSVAAGLAPGLAGRNKGFVADTLPGQQISLAAAGYRTSGLVAGIIRMELGFHLPAGAIGLSLQGRADLFNTAKPDALFREKRYALGIVLSFRRNLSAR